MAGPEAMAIIRETIKKLPNMKYALGVLALSAVTSLVLYFAKSPEAALFGPVAVLGGMFLLRLFMVWTPLVSRPDVSIHLQIILGLFVAALVVVVGLGLAKFYLYLFPSGPQTVQPLTEFPVHKAEWSFGLPDAFGPIGDPAGSRQWLESLDESTRGRYGQDAMALWLYTDAFEGSYGGFPVHVHVGSADGKAPEISIQAFRFSLPTVHNAISPMDSQGAKIEYRFDLKNSQEGDRIVVYMGMSKQTYDAIKNNTFRIRSKPFQPSR